MDIKAIVRMGSGAAFGLMLICGLALIGGCPPSDGGDGNTNDNDNGNVNDNINDNDNDNVNDNDNGNENDNDNTNDNGGDFVAGLPLANFSTDDFVGSGNCAVCHSELRDEGGNNVSIDLHWRATMMSNAAKDPLFLATVESEILRAPHIQEIIEDTCAKCHMPMAYTQAIADGTDTRMFDGGFLDPDNALHEAAMDGVSCSLCHQVTDDFLTSGEESFDGNYVIDTSTEPPDRILYGPYDEPQQPDVMRSTVEYTPTFGPHIRQSGLCATCHTLFTPTLDADGEIVGMFPEQTPFLEWLESDFGDGFDDDDRACQSCHMPEADGMVEISRVPTNLNGREPFSQHKFLGGNVLMLHVLRDNIEELGLSASTLMFQAAILETENFLQTETAELIILESGFDGDLLRAVLRVVNKTGHKFPTSFPSRMAWIHLTVTDDAGEVVFESGAPQADGSVADDDALGGTAVEPHYDVLTSEDQVQIYQAVMENTDGEITYTLLRGHAYAKDNRLLPVGFDKANADEAIAVYGAAAGDSNFVDGSDQVTFLVDVAGLGDSFTVTAELLYQSISAAYADDVRNDEGSLIDRFGDMYDAVDKTPTAVASDETDVVRGGGAG